MRHLEGRGWRARCDALERLVSHQATTKAAKEKLAREQGELDKKETDKPESDNSVAIFLKNMLNHITTQK